MVLRIGWCCERLINPSHQIAVGEEIHTQERDEIGQAPMEAGGQLQIAQQQHRDQRRPYLGSDRVRGGTDEGLDLQVLLDGLEEQLDLPAILVDCGNGAGAQAVMIGDEDQRVARILADCLDTAQQMRALVLCSGTGQTDGLILDDVPVLRYLMFLNHLEQRVGRSRYAEDPKTGG